MFKIIHFIVFGMIAIVNCKFIQEYDDTESNNYEPELRKLIEQIFNQGKLDTKKHTHQHSHSNRGFKHDMHHRHQHESKPSLTNIQTLNLFMKKQPPYSQRSDDTADYTVHQAEGIRCRKDEDCSYGNCVDSRCGENRSDMQKDSADDVAELLNELEHELKHGPATNGDRDVWRKDELRCRGNRCGRGRSDNDEKDIADNDNLRCRGNRCGRGRNDNEDLTIDGSDDNANLRCRGSRCGRYRDNRDDRNDDDAKDLRCSGNRCGRGRSYKDLRCIGNDCHYRSPDDDLRIESNQIKKYKISDDLDAIVIDVSDLEHLMKKFGEPRENNLQGVRLLENDDLEELLAKKKESDEIKDIEAIVIDLSRVQNGDVLANSIKKSVLPKKRIMMQEVTDAKLNRKVSDLFLQNQKRVLAVNNLVENDKLVKNKAVSKILPHIETNGDFYMPKLIHEAHLSHWTGQQSNEVTERKNIKYASPSLKSMFPMTSKQRNRLINSQQKRRQPPKLWGRRAEQNIGVPFELQVEGLGQVNA